MDTLGTILLDVMDPIACNADGSSKYNLDTFPKGAEATRMSTLIANGQEEYIGEKPIMTGFVEKLTQQGVENAADYIFIYTNDWRKGQAQYAKDIDAYIDEVRALTGSDKVDIYGSALAVNAVPRISIITAKKQRFTRPVSTFRQ